MNGHEPFVDQWVDRAVGEFDRNPLCAQLLRRLARESYKPFVHAALRHLGESCARSASHRLMSSLVAQDESVFQRLSDPGDAARTRAINIFNNIFIVNPSFDVTLAKMLPDREGANYHLALTGARGGRTIELLDDRSEGKRLVPILSHLVESQDEWLSTRAAIFIGRRIRNTAWVQRLLKGNDDRVRAYAIESIWGVDTPAARSILHQYLQDGSSRVAGNCMVGLHKIGEEGIDEEIRSMAVALNAEFRATAAWTMGKIGDAAFIGRLTALAKDEDVSVRRAALYSLLEIRRARPPGEPLAAMVETEPAAVDILDEVHVQNDPIFDLRLDGSNFAAGRSRAAWFGR